MARAANAPCVVASDEVESALAEGRPVVALESTIVAHGFPPAERRTVADELEGAVRAAGAVPATVAVVDGVLRAGLSSEQLDHIADDAAPVAKTAALDLGVYLATKATAATTVSATMMAASQLGIRVFATGGIGGVHRGNAGDVSSDLAALATYPVAVVSAGAKAILDLPRTLEALESLAVLVLGYRCDELPAFYCRSSGLRLAHRVDEAADIAEMIHWRCERLSQGGVLVCRAIDEIDALDQADVEAAITAALAKAALAQVGGKELTPFLLAEVAEYTGGATVAANRSLALGNASLAGQIAGAYRSKEAARL